MARGRVLVAEFDTMVVRSRPGSHRVELGDNAVIRALSPVGARAVGTLSGSGASLPCVRTEDLLAGSSIDTEDLLAGSSIDTEDLLAGSSIGTEDLPQGRA
jgi:hypothetical protein